jgi:hypothetical protein
MRLLRHINDLRAFRLKGWGRSFRTFFGLLGYLPRIGKARSFDNIGMLKLL